MAQRTVTTLVDDLDGREIAQGEGETVTFELDRSQYEIDLSRENAAKLRDALSTFIEAARKTSGRRGRPRGGGAVKTDSDQLKAIRDWARSQGMEVSERGRISGKVRDAYNAAH